jgi:hypothetical protein
MATTSTDSHSGSPSYNKYLYQNNTIQRPIFATILEEPGDNTNHLQDLNTSSIPMGNNNNNSSFENSINGIHLVDYHTMNKFRPSLNLSCLPPVFEIPKQKIPNKNNINMLNITNNQSINNSLYNDKNNIKLMRGSRLNLKPIMNNSNINSFNNTAGGNNNTNNNKSNFISLPPINSHTNYNKLKEINENNFKNNNGAFNIRNQRKKLKPIQMGKSLPYKNNLGSSNNIHEVRRTLDVNNNDINKGNFYYNKNDKLKEEKTLRNKEMSNMSMNQNKNYVEKNIVILNNETSLNYLNNNIIDKNINEFVSINKNGTRVIYIPTLKIYNKFDIPLKSYNFYQNYIDNWKKMLKGNIKIKNIVEDNKLNVYYIIIERAKNCSLGNLIRSIGSINENIILYISKQIIPLIKLYNSIFDYRINEINEQLYNFIDMDYIWFNKQYNIALYPGKLDYIQKDTNNIKKYLLKIYNLNENQAKENNDESKNIQLNIDLMNYGITLININIYILGLTVNDLFELINDKQEHNKNDCCLFHYFYKNIKLFSNFYDCLKQNNELKENYYDFLHNLTSFNINENHYEKVSMHSFIQNSSVTNENLNINDLISLGKMYDFSNEFFTSNSNIISLDLIGKHIKNVLPNLKDYYIYYNIYDVKTLCKMNYVDLDELCRELRVNSEELNNKLLEVYEDFFKEKYK